MSYINPFRLQHTFTHSSTTHKFEIHWTQVGNASGPPVIFVHGTPWSSVVWHDLAAALKDRFCIYLYDHPGFERSPRPARLDGGESELDASLELRAEASAALIKHWSLSEPPHVVAHDNGGLVSLRLYLQHGIKLASLCLVDVVALGPFGLPFFDLVANNFPVFLKIPSTLSEGFSRAYVRSATVKPLSTQIEDLLTAQWLQGGAQGPERFLQEMLQAHNRSTGDLESKYADVGRQIPVKVCWGAKDTWLPPEIAPRLAKALNAKEVVLIDEAGHLVHYDNPSKLALEVGVWLLANRKD